jgi:phospholipid-transporting ATPase
MVPADCVLLRAKKDMNGMCFVQTTDLDGERNLKPIVTSKFIENYFEKIFLERSVAFEAQFTQPCADMYYYDGEIILTKLDGEKDQAQASSKEIHVDIKMFLARGAVLRNSGHVYALVT